MGPRQIDIAYLFDEQRQETLATPPADPGLFDEPPPNRGPHTEITPRWGGEATASTSCRGCNMPIRVPITAPARLCQACAADLGATRERLNARLSAQHALLEQAMATFGQARDTADDATRQRYDKVLDARLRHIGEAGEAALRQRERQVLADASDPLGAVLRAEAQREAVAERVSAEVERLNAAIDELRWAEAEQAGTAPHADLGGLLADEIRRAA